MSTVADLFALFAGLPRAFGKFTITDKKPNGKYDGRATTERGAYTPELWQLHLAGTQGLGVVPILDDGHVWWGAIDIDKYDLDLHGVENDVARLNLPLLPTRSKSGGAHLYLFCAEPTDAALVRGKLSEWAVALGYGGVEIYPKQTKLASQEDIGNWLNMPYFAEDIEVSTRFGIYKGERLSLTQYIERATLLRVSADCLSGLQVAMPEALDGIPPCLQALCGRGFPEGSRNTGLYNLAVYARKRFGDEGFADIVGEYNARFFIPPLPHTEVGKVIKSVARKSYFYTCNKEPICGMCNKQLCHTREFGIAGETELDVTIDSDAIKVLTNPPYWIIGVNGVRMEITSGDMKNQERFRQLCMEKIDKLPTKLPGRAWDAHVNTVLLSAEKVEAAPDSGPYGQFQFLVEQFCTSKAQATVAEELLTGKPWVNGGRVHFRSGDLIRFLEAEHFREFNKRQVYAALRDMGVRHHQHQLDGRCVQTWSVPEYPKSESPWPVPRAVVDGF